MSHTGVAQVFQQLSHRAFGVHENLPTRNSGRNNVLEDRMMPDSELIDKSWASRDFSAVFAALNALQASPAEALDDRFLTAAIGVIFLVAKDSQLGDFVCHSVSWNAKWSNFLVETSCQAQDAKSIPTTPRNERFHIVWAQGFQMQ
jgi:hypothetical protein